MRPSVYGGRVLAALSVLTFGADPAVAGPLTDPVEGGQATPFHIIPAWDFGLIALDLGMHSRPETHRRRTDTRTAQRSDLNRSRRAGRRAGANTTTRCAVLGSSARRWPWPSRTADAAISGKHDGWRSGAVKFDALRRERADHRRPDRDRAKQTVQRPRPCSYQSERRYREALVLLPTDDDAYLSFFSGHTGATTAALSATATYMAFREDDGGSPRRLHPGRRPRPDRLRGRRAHARRQTLPDGCVDRFRGGGRRRGRARAASAPLVAGCQGGRQRRDGDRDGVRYAGERWSDDRGGGGFLRGGRGGRLQWGLDLMSTGGDGWGRAAALPAVASMGPGPDVQGGVVGLERKADERPASMGPGPDVQGGNAWQIRVDAGHSASMGPGPDVQGGAAVGEDALQALPASMGPGPDVQGGTPRRSSPTTPGTSFNGAWTWVQGGAYPVLEAPGDLGASMGPGPDFQAGHGVDDVDRRNVVASMGLDLTSRGGPEPRRGVRAVGHASMGPGPDVQGGPASADDARQDIGASMGPGPDVQGGKPSSSAWSVIQTLQWGLDLTSRGGLSGGEQGPVITASMGPGPDVQGGHGSLSRSSAASDASMGPGPDVQGGARDRSRRFNTSRSFNGAWT
jgi:hypothetical protein